MLLLPGPRTAVSLWLLALVWGTAAKAQDVERKLATCCSQAGSEGQGPTDLQAQPAAWHLRHSVRTARRALFHCPPTLLKQDAFRVAAHCAWAAVLSNVSPLSFLLSFWQRM